MPVKIHHNTSWLQEKIQNGNYDVDIKKLCSVKDVKEQYDAANLRLVQRNFQNEIRTLYQVTLSMRY